MKLYHSPVSPNARRVRIYLAERGIDAELVTVDLGAKAQFSDAYAAINPRQVVPTLLLADGTAIGEVPAIIRYLDEAFPENPLDGATPKDKALVQMWERRMEQEGLLPAVAAVRNAVQGLAGRALAGPHGYAQIPGLIERGRQIVSNLHADLELWLSQRPFVAGDSFSVADITAVVAIDFATKALSMPIPEGNAATLRWYAAVAARPSFSA
ncbi:MAG: glutathione S-transferase [Sphingomonas sp.]|nr:glutathione S-transferase [Sphingomonas sp.]